MSDENVSDAQAKSLADDEGGFFEEGAKRRGTFFQVFDGTICLKSKEVVEGWEGPITTTHPRTKAEIHTYVKRFDKLVARIINVKKDRKKFDDGTKITNYNFTILGGGKKGTLQVTYMDSLLRKFLKVCPNIDFDRPILFGAFKKMVDGKSKQLISIRQGEGSDYDNWPPVPFYWRKDTDEKGNVIEGSPSKGRDGSILPEAIHDEEDDTWDFKAQNKFLIKHFVENELPVIQQIAEARGLNNMTVDDDDMPTHTGGSQAEVEIPVVTSRPDVIVAPSVAEAMTPSQSTEIRKLAKQVGKTADFLSEKILEADFDELSIQGAAYLKYRIEKKIKKAREEDPNAYPDPEPPSKLREAIETNKKKKSDDDDDDEDDWDAAPAPKAKAKPADDDDDDDDDDD